MTREEIIRMAQESGAIPIHKDYSQKALVGNENIERFAALVAAAKDAEHAKKLKNDIHSCGPTCTRYACVAVREAVEAEREACAALIQSNAEACDTYSTARAILESNAAAIRARGNHD